MLKNYSQFAGSKHILCRIQMNMKITNLLLLFPYCFFKSNYLYFSKNVVFLCKNI